MVTVSRQPQYLVPATSRMMNRDTPIAAATPGAPLRKNSW
jgi:hypothetical protein